jgi:anti-anti-sigma regulatory factor
MNLLMSLVVGTTVSVADMRVNCDAVQDGTYTVSSCWNCFQHLLNDCDRTIPQPGNNTDDRKRACYQAANNFFTFCLGRTSGGAGGNPRSKPIRTPVQPERLTTDEGMSMRVDFGQKVTSEQIVVFVRHNVDGEIAMEKVKPFAFINNDGTYDILVDSSSVDLSDDSSIGIIIALVDTNGNVENAVATLVEVENPLDLNRDGLVDNSDLIELTNKFAAGEITHEEFVKRSSQIK